MSDWGHLVLLLGAGLVGVLVGLYLTMLVRRFYPTDTTETDASSVVPRWAGRVIVPVTAVLFVVMAWLFGWSWQLPAYLFFATVGVALSAIDLTYHRLPNAVVFPSLAIGSALLLGAALLEGRWSALLDSVLGAIALFVLYLILALISPRGMGMGDVKFALIVGLFLTFQGWGVLIMGGFLGFLLGAVVGVITLITRKGGLKTAVPFGPSMFVGAVLAVIWATSI